MKKGVGYSQIPLALNGSAHLNRNVLGHSTFTRM
jgi:hypothetical protein